MANVKTILVDVEPRDNEDVEPRDNEHAELERARQLAAASGASVFLLLTAYDTSLTGGVLTGGSEQARDRWLAELREWLAARAGTLREQGIRARTEVVWHSPRYDSLLAKADELQADVIVRTAHHRSAVGRWLLGASDWELVRRAPQPVWIVKKPYPAGERGVRVLAAVDPGHPGEKKAGLDRKLISAGDRIVQLFGGTLHVFHAYRPAAAATPVAATGQQAALPALAMGPELIEELKQRRRTQLDRLAAPFGVSPERVHLVAGDTRGAIEERVRALGIDVVVAGAVSRGRIERLLIGSTAERILDAVDCDVVVIKPDAFPASPR